MVAIYFIIGCKKDDTTDIRDAFVATYSVSETWTENNKQVTKPVFTISVEKATQKADMLLLNNFANYGAGVTVEANISGNNITLGKQTLPNLKVISGSGILSDTLMTLNYSETYNSVSISVSATARKR